MTETEQQDENQQPGWWGSTLGKLKSALARTKSAVVDSVLETDETPATSSESQLAPDTTPQAGQLTPVSAEPGAQVGSAQAESPAPNATTASAPGTAPDPFPAPNQPTAQAQSAAPTQSPASTQLKSAPARTAPVAIDEDYLENLEEKLIRADLGIATAETLVGHLRKEARAKRWNSHDVEDFLKREFTSMLTTTKKSALRVEPGKLSIVLVVGVNGTGKTTSIGKLCWRFKSQGKKVLMAAADTFRAAAESQLEIWSERAGVEIVRLPDGADPGAVVYQAIQKAKTENFDVLVIDTAGRLHNKANLMAELKKVRIVIEKNAQELPLESLLVLDASTGQNGLQQAKVFTEVCPLTGVILTKLDGTAKGGVVFSITRELQIPVKLIGLGEQIDDLRDFEPGLFVEALFQR